MDIIEASENGDLERVLQLIEEGINVNFQDRLGYTALIKASYYGRLEITKELIKAGANLDIQNSNGYTSLIVASFNCHLEIVKELIEAGSNTDLKNKYNDYCALYYSLMNKNYEISNLLLKSIKNFNKKCLKFKNRGITFFYLFPFIIESKNCILNKIPDDLIGFLLKF